MICSLVTESAVAALKENDAQIEAARNIEVRAALLADHLLVVRNFVSVLIRVLRDSGRTAARALGSGVGRAGSELKELGGDSWKQFKAGLPEGVGTAARVLPLGLLVALLAQISVPVAGLAGLIGGFRQIISAINKLKSPDQKREEKQGKRNKATTKGTSKGRSQ